MEAIGGIIIFLSWVLTNTIHQNFKDLKQSLNSANGTFRLYNTLHEVRSMVNSVAAEVIQRNPNDKDASQFRAGKHANKDIELIRNDFSMTRLNAQQVNELMDFTAEVNALSIALDDENDTHKEIQYTMRGVGDLVERYRKLERAAERELNVSNDFTTLSDFKAIPDYIATYKRDILPQVPEFYPKIIELSNIRNNEASKKLSKLKKRAKLSRYASIIVYIIGTTLIIWSKLEK
ncbi:hypothetical protein [Aquimarina sp. 2201CG14-23]|uniref:hypothetical protein n=1 Tax=Aquimarina mycalae TaxID=3040073 RepID=UPI0024780872|nr:hypothetical protein [Aquimarina sp. 2201CG14-23]MDH7447958.1 hypothetical protein [Aquimarina sp. 2201CG14-23]